MNLKKWALRLGSIERQQIDEPPGGLRAGTVLVEDEDGRMRPALPHEIPSSIAAIADQVRSAGGTS